MYLLYYSPGACSLAAHILLEELAQPFKLELRSALKGIGTQTPEYLSINPKGRVPALLCLDSPIGEEAGVLTELPAILAYLALEEKTGRFIPGTPGELGRCLEWLNWLSGTVHSLSYGQVWRPQRFVDDENLFPAIVEKGRRNVMDNYRFIEQHIVEAQGPSVLRGYNVVHPVLLVFWIWGKWIDLDMKKSFPAWHRLVQSVIERPAVQRALATEGIDLKLFD
ncbi:glutathione S-transferase family protein [Pseudomonas sp. TNT2022 ID642]|uniref:glutathione S-transferase family protein n=1 Tax=Pseudomonas sp. TNT2022 ID642 TaxID=2942632 RepID=UPI00235F322B|nr:glutathione S-transferase [Pseudomonas sp. TNT2022 ID642]MDD1001734.1 glutathione S-transferase [Pseudomonas sp. TNT2022 ID642]